MTTAGHSRIAVLLLLVVIVGGSWIRLVRLGENHFRGDELRHYFVSESLERGDGPLLPFGARYVRGADVSRLVGVFSRHIDDPELAARLPVALFGVLNLVLFAAIAWAIGGPWAAVFATLLLAIYPEAVGQSRRVRFYTYQLNFGLIALFAGWKALHWTGRPEPPGPAEVRRSWLWLGVAATAFGLAARVQIVTLSVAVAFGLCLAIAALVNANRHGMTKWRANVPLQATVAALVLGVVAVALRPEFVRTVVWHAFSVPTWVGQAQSPLTYYWTLAGALPLVVSLAPLSFLATARRQPALAVYLLIWFGLPFVMLSFVLPFKGDRFLLLAQPALFLATGIAAAEGLRMLASAIRAGLGNTFDKRWRERAAIACCAIVALTAVATTPAFNAARRIPDSTNTAADRENWTAAAAVLADQPDLDRLKLGSSDEFAPLYYMKRLDFHSAGGGEVDLQAISPATGVPRLLTPLDIRRFYRDGATVVLALDSSRLVHGLIDRGLHNVLERDATELCAGGCGSLLLYRWEFGPLGSE